ncbi:MAG: L,D-transpeptidase family protein [Lentisphaerota bacterium]
MTDIYLRREKSKKGCLLVILLFTALAAAAAYWFLYGPKLPSRQNDEAASPDVVADEGSSAQPQPIAQPPPAGRDPGLGLLTEARQLKTGDQLQESRVKCFEILKVSSNSVARAEAESLLGDLDVALVLSPRAMPEKTEYTVQSGDSLAALAKRFNTTVDVIQKGNGIPGQMIRVGQRLRIFSGKFSIEVDKSDNLLVLKLNDQFFKRYRVGTGQYGKTPVGNFNIMQKIAQPTWWRPDGKSIPYGDPENLLGTHWLSLNAPGYGIHGTWEPDTIGKQASAGCIRLLNNEVEELFILVPEGTPVTITD